MKSHPGFTTPLHRPNMGKSPPPPTPPNQILTAAIERDTFHHAKRLHGKISQESHDNHKMFYKCTNKKRIANELRDAIRNQNGLLRLAEKTRVTLNVESKFIHN